MNFKKINNIHFVGIGGIGMSGIAELLINLGFNVSGSDLIESELTDKLKRKNATIYYSHNPKNVHDCDILVYSSAVDINNVELIEAKSRKIPILKRAEMLGELVTLKKTSIAVSGTHGKTTSTTMIGEILTTANLDPTLVVGGLVKNLNTNSKIGEGDYIVVEADEFDKSFLQIKPTIAVLTNIEEEHMDCYNGINDLLFSFTKFANSVPFYGSVIACIDSPYIKKIIKNIKRPITTYGISKDAIIRASNLKFDKNKSSYELLFNNTSFGQISLKAPGHHNIMNSLAAAAVAFDLKLNPKIILKGIENYSGVRRRFEIKGIRKDILVVDDYAHHPTEVIETIRAAKKGWNRRLITIFQPHLFSRTKAFYKDFAKALNESDIIILTDIYPAREKPQKNISSKLIFNEIKKHNHKNLFFLDNIDNINPFLTNIVKRNDMVLTMGAGTIWRYGQKFYDFLNK